MDTADLAFPPQPRSLQKTFLLYLGVMALLPVYAALMLTGLLDEFVATLAPLAEAAARHGTPWSHYPARVQHFLFVGWLVSIPAILWLSISVLLVHRMRWNWAMSGPSTRQLVGMVSGSTIFAASAVVLLFFGVSPPYGKFEALARLGDSILILYAGIFAGLLFFSACALLAASRLLDRSGSAPPEVQNSVLRLLDPGRSRK